MILLFILIGISIWIVGTTFTYKLWEARCDHLTSDENDWLVVLSLLFWPFALAGLFGSYLARKFNNATEKS